jgi:hypothetical protein
MADALSLSATYSSAQGRARPLPMEHAPAPSPLAALFSHMLMQRGLRFGPQAPERTFPDSSPVMAHNTPWYTISPSAVLVRLDRG